MKSCKRFMTMQGQGAAGDRVAISLRPEDRPIGGQRREGAGDVGLPGRRRPRGAMTDGAQLAWAVAGFPRWGTLVPGPRTKAWATVRKRLEAQCSSMGAVQRIRTPGVRWGLIRGALPRGGIPSGTTWGALFGDATLAAIVAAMSKTRDSDGVRMATWNPRWMVSLHSEQGVAKRKWVQRAIGAGMIVALQETHGATRDIAVWSGLFPGAEVVATGAARRSCLGDTGEV